MARVAIVGVGAIGGVIAALLETTGLHEIILCTRRPLHHLTVETPNGAISVRARNVTDPAMVGPVDWVLVATKTYDVEGASGWFRRPSADNTPVAVLQNGVEHRRNFAPFVKASNILPVIINCPAERSTNGLVRQRGPAKMHVENGQLGASFSQLFRGSAAEIELTDDFVTAAWSKLCVNSVGAISAVLMKPARIFQDPAVGEVALEIIGECAAVGRAEGAHLPDSIGTQVLAGYRAQPPDSINSILADRLAGRPVEVDARNGIIIRKGAEHGILTPANRMIVALLNALV